MANWLRRLTPKQAILFLSLAILGVALSILLGRPKAFNYLDGWDFLTFWEGSYLLTTGESPYDSTAWLDVHTRYGFPPQNQSYAYPLPLAVILLPLGLLPLEVAAMVWVALTYLAILFAFKLIIGMLRFSPSPAYVLPALAGVFLFRPVAVTFYINQIDGFTLLWLTSSLFLWERKKLFWGGVLIAFTVLKPQQGIPLLAFLGVWQVLRSQWKILLGEGFTLLSLYGLGVLFDPAWLQRWLSFGVNKVSLNFYSTPTLWGLSALACKPSLSCVYWLGAILSGVAVLMLFWVFLRKSAQDSFFIMGLVICITLLISPYLWTYSQLLLILPILMITVAFYRMQWPYLLTTSFPLLLDLFSFGMVGFATIIGADLLSALVPLVVGGLLLLVYRKDPALLRSGAAAQQLDESAGWMRRLAG